MLTSLTRYVTGKRTLLLALLLGAAALLPAHARDAILDDILSLGTLKVGTTGDWDPMSMKDPVSNSYRGDDIDVVTELAGDLYVELERVAIDWKTPVNGIAAGQVHTSGSASVSPARARAAGCTDSYTQERQDDQIWINYLDTWIELERERGFFDELGSKRKLSD